MHNISCVHQGFHYYCELSFMYQDEILQSVSWSKEVRHSVPFIFSKPWREFLEDAHKKIEADTTTHQVCVFRLVSNQEALLKLSITDGKIRKPTGDRSFWNFLDVLVLQSITHGSLWREPHIEIAVLKCLSAKQPFLCKNWVNQKLLFVPKIFKGTEWPMKETKGWWPNVVTCFMWNLR